MTGLDGFEKLRILYSLLNARTALIKMGSIYPDDEFLSKNITHLNRLFKKLPTVGTVKDTTT
ncbi:MAG: hypothetical protein KAT79_03410 [candidate division Zixibacteria bacterium]|nr:hypothetical protein [candidate division Zixibacteria bacterium]